MRLSKYHFVITLVLSFFLLNSCENEPLDVGLDEGFPDNGMLGTFTATIDGERVQFIGSGVYTNNETFFDEESELVRGWNISGMSLDGKAIWISLFPAEFETGEYDVEDEFFYNISYTVNIGGDTISYDSVSGVVNITDINEEAEVMSGTFNAVLEDFDEIEEEVYIEGMFEDLEFRISEIDFEE